MLQKVFIVIISCVMVSCGAAYEISVQHDGSASVIMGNYPCFKNKRYSQSNAFTIIDTTEGGRVTIEISNIDSLGNYLPLHPPGFFRFNMDGNTFKIQDGFTKPFKINDWFCCGLYIFIEFENDIKKIESPNRLLRQKDKRTVLIKKTRRQFIKGKKKIDVKIILENSNNK